jgi:hypothetical protein
MRGSGHTDDKYKKSILLLLLFDCLCLYLIEPSLMSLHTSQLIRIREFLILHFIKSSLIGRLKHQMHRERHLVKGVRVFWIEIDILFRELNHIRRKKRYSKRRKVLVGSRSKREMKEIGGGRIILSSSMYALPVLF